MSFENNIMLWLVERQMENPEKKINNKKIVFIYFVII